MKRLGNLQNEVISYTNALLCYITEHDPAPVIAHLNTNTRELFEQDYQYLKTTDDTFLSKSHIQNSDQLFLAYKQIEEGFTEKNFNLVIAASNRLLGQNSNDAFLYNGIGYAFLGKKTIPVCY